MDIPQLPGFGKAEQVEKNAVGQHAINVEAKPDDINLRWTFLTLRT